MQSNPSSPTVSGWYSFNHEGTLKNNDDLTASDISLAFTKRMVVQPGQNMTVYFYLAIAEDVANVTAAVDIAQSKSGKDGVEESADK